MATHNDYITNPEFSRWTAEIGRQLTANAADVERGLSKIDAHLEALNGRTRKNTEAIAVIERELEAIKSEDESIERAVTSIQEEGCHQYKEHRNVLNAIEGSGALPSTDEHAGFRLPTLTLKQKAAASIGVTALLIPAVGDLFRLITAVVAWVAQHGAVR